MILDRGFIIVKPKDAFFKWSNEYDDDFDDLDDNEPSIYLIEDDFYDDETVLKSHYKQIFLSELLGVTDNTEVYPDITWDNFNSFFDCDLGTTVFDLKAKS